MPLVSMAKLVNVNPKKHGLMFRGAHDRITSYLEVHECHAPIREDRRWRSPELVGCQIEDERLLEDWQVGHENTTRVAALPCFAGRYLPTQADLQLL